MVRLLLGHYAPPLEQNDTRRYTVKRIPAVSKIGIGLLILSNSPSHLDGVLINQTAIGHVAPVLRGVICTAG